MTPTANRRVLISAGGSGGHFFPMLAIAEELKLQCPSCEIEFVGTKQGIEYRVLSSTKQFRLHIIPACRFYRMKRTTQMFNGGKFFWALFIAAWAILRFRPCVIIGSGSFVSAPVMAIALLFRKKFIVQEQNASPGITNRVFGKYAHLCFLSHPPKNRSIFKNYEIIGNPIRKNIEQLADVEPILPFDPIHICLIGGSQGAHVLNKTLCAGLPKLEPYSDNLRITHQTGENDYDEVKRHYRKTGIQHTVIKFVDDMPALYQRATLMISRAGSIVVEYLAAGKPSILVPIAQSSGNHQKSNADVLVDKEAAVLITEHRLTPDSLAEAIITLITRPERINTMSANARGFHRKNSAARAAEIIRLRFL